MKISTKLIAGFSVITILLVIVAATGWWGISSMNELLDEYALTEGKIVEYAQRSRANILGLRRFEKDVFLNIDSSDKVAEYEKKWQETLGNCNKRFDGIEQLLTKLEKTHDAVYAGKLKSDVKTLRAELNTYVGGFTKTMGGIRNGEIKTAVDANKSMDSVKEAVHKLEKQVVEFALKVDEMMEHGVKEADVFEKKLVATIIIVSLIAIVLAVVLTVIIIASIRKPLNSMLHMVTDIAQGEGDLTRRLDAGSKDELAEISAMFNQFIEKLRSIISKVAQTSELVSSASTQLHSTAEQIATGAEEVASQTGTVATASEEMAATSSDIARNCLNAADTSNRTSQTAQTGASVVRETIQGMEKIAVQVQGAAKAVEDLGARSDQIGAIVGTIEDIADQTNLLALNAAIEAARAGEQGRGFAVVADEVRALAERTTKATREIGEMIKAIQGETRGAVRAMEEGVSEVERGTEYSRRSGEALEMILSQIHDVTMQVNQIATAAEEQTATTGEITTNIQQITDVVQSTAHGAHETATASADLSRQAEELQRLVRQFKL